MTACSGTILTVLHTSTWFGDRWVLLQRLVDLSTVRPRFVTPMHWFVPLLVSIFYSEDCRNFQIEMAAEMSAGRGCLSRLCWLANRSLSVKFRQLLFVSNKRCPGCAFCASCWLANRDLSVKFRQLLFVSNKRCPGCAFCASADWLIGACR